MTETVEELFDIEDVDGVEIEIVTPEININHNSYFENNIICDPHSQKLLNNTSKDTKETNHHHQNDLKQNHNSSRVNDLAGPDLLIRTQKSLIKDRKLKDITQGVSLLEKANLIKENIAHKTGKAPKSAQNNEIAQDKVDYLDDEFPFNLIEDIDVSHKDISARDSNHKSASFPRVKLHRAKANSLQSSSLPSSSAHSISALAANTSSHNLLKSINSTKSQTLNLLTKTEPESELYSTDGEVLDDEDFVLEEIETEEPVELEEQVQLDEEEEETPIGEESESESELNLIERILSEKGPLREENKLTTTKASESETKLNLFERGLFDERKEEGIEELESLVRLVETGEETTDVEQLEGLKVARVEHREERRNFHKKLARLEAVLFSDDASVKIYYLCGTLKLLLNSSYDSYVQLMNDWLSGQLERQQYEQQIRKCLPKQALVYHNRIMLAILKKSFDASESMNDAELQFSQHNLDVSNLFKQFDQIHSDTRNGGGACRIDHHDSTTKEALESDHHTHPLDSNTPRDDEDDDIVLIKKSKKRKRRRILDDDEEDDGGGGGDNSEQELNSSGSELTGHLRNKKKKKRKAMIISSDEDDAEDGVFLVDNNTSSSSNLTRPDGGSGCDQTKTIDVKSSGLLKTTLTINRGYHPVGNTHLTSTSISSSQSNVQSSSPLLDQLLSSNTPISLLPVDSNNSLPLLSSKNRTGSMDQKSKQKSLIFEKNEFDTPRTSTLSNNVFRINHDNGAEANQIMDKPASSTALSDPKKSTANLLKNLTDKYLASISEMAEVQDNDTQVSKELYLSPENVSDGTVLDSTNSANNCNVRLKPHSLLNESTTSLLFKSDNAKLSESATANIMGESGLVSLIRKASRKKRTQRSLLYDPNASGELNGSSLEHDDEIISEQNGDTRNGRVEEIKQSHLKDYNADEVNGMGVYNGDIKHVIQPGNSSDKAAEPNHLTNTNRVNDLGNVMLEADENWNGSSANAKHFRDGGSIGGMNVNGVMAHLEAHSSDGCNNSIDLDLEDDNSDGELQSLSSFRKFDGIITSNNSNNHDGSIFTLNHSNGSASNKKRLPKQKTFYDEVSLPDNARLGHRISEVASELGFSEVDTRITTLCNIGLKNFMKKILSQLVTSRSAFLLHNNRIRHHVGFPLPNPYLPTSDRSLQIDANSTNNPLASIFMLSKGDTLLSSSLYQNYECPIIPPTQLDSQFRPKKYGVGKNELTFTSGDQVIFDSTAAKEEGGRTICKFRSSSGVLCTLDRTSSTTTTGCNLRHLYNLLTRDRSLIPVQQVWCQALYRTIAAFNNEHQPDN